MEGPFLQLDVERREDVFCVRLRSNRLDEPAIYQVGEEFLRLINEQGCRKLVLSLGPEPLDCLYSIFLTKLITLRRRLLEKGGAMKLCNVHPETLGVFEACRLKEFFDFVPDEAAAVAELTK